MQLIGSTQRLHCGPLLVGPLQELFCLRESSLHQKIDLIFDTSLFNRLIKNQRFILVNPYFLCTSLTNAISIKVVDDIKDALGLLEKALTNYLN